MNQITIFRQIRIKELVTEASKQKGLQLLNDELTAIADEQKIFEEKKNKALTEASLKGADSNQLAQFRQHFEAEGSRYYLRRDELIMRMNELSALTVGQEITIAEIEGPHEVKVGDLLDQAAQAEIVVKDGIVVEIR